MEFETRLNKLIKLKICDDSERLFLPNRPIYVFILPAWENNISKKIGMATALVWLNKKIEWMDIKINNPKIRGKGIGSLVVQFMCNYLKKNGATEIFGHISDVDDIERVKFFWEKNGFTVTDLKNCKGHFVAEVKLSFKSASLKNF